METLAFITLGSDLQNTIKNQVIYVVMEIAEISPSSLGEGQSHTNTSPPDYSACSMFEEQ